MNLEPPIAPHVADGLDLGAMPLRVLDVYRLATAPVWFSADRLAATLDQAAEWTSVTPSGEVARAARPQASNNWAVHGSRTATGRPMLASDPHRLHAIPSLRYLVHLTAPGLDLIGAVEPNFPGITIGHNGHAAFGLTLFLGPDQEDVYVYDTDPARPHAYRYGDGWEDVRVVEEDVEVRGAAPHTVRLNFTRHGPVIDDRTVPGRAFAIRTVWSEPGSTPYGASLAGMRARSLEQFRAAMRRWGAPAVNQVYADGHGDIAWVTAGFSPVRRNWDGLLPVPGDGRYEWDGFLDPDLLPSARNPPAGFVASANAMNLPDGWPYDERPIGCEWDDPSRARRIEELLGTGGVHSLQTSCAMQHDVLSIPARRLCALLERLPQTDRLATPLAMLRDWDHRLLADSGAAALFEIWWSRHVKPALFEGLVPDAAARSLLPPGDVERLLVALERPARPDGLGSEQIRDALLADTLSAACRECVALMGDDPSGWSWGQIHAATF
jgi:penicillin amidase